MGTAASAEGDATRNRREAAMLVAVAAAVTVAWTLFGLNQLAIGPSDWDDAMYCDRAATGNVAWDIRNRYVHVWGLRAAFALTPYRELGAQVYASLCVCALSVFALLSGRRIGGMRCGLLAMVTTLLFPPLLKYLTVPHVDLTLAVWMSAGCLAAACASEATGRRALIWAGCAGAATVLALRSKETALVLLPVLAVILWPLRARALEVLATAAAGAATAAGLLWLAHLSLDAPGSTLSSANYVDYFSRRPVVPSFDSGQIARPAKLKHDLLSQLTTPAMLPLSLLAARGLLPGFQRDAFLRALTGLALGVGAFTSYIAYASRDIQVEDRYVVALAVPLCVGAAYGCEQLLRRVPGAEEPMRDRPNLTWLLPLLAVLCLLSGRGLWVWAAGGQDYSEQAAMLFLVPFTTLVLFATPWLTDNRWLPRASIALLLLISATAGMGGARRHVQAKTAELAPWRTLAAAADAGNGKLAVTRGGQDATRVRFRLSSLSRRPAGHVQTRKIGKPAAAARDELLLDGRAESAELRAQGYRVIAKFSGGRRAKGAWTAYAPPAPVPAALH